MSRPGHVPITRLRFRGRGPTLRAMCKVFQDHPGVGLSATEVAGYIERQTRIESRIAAIVIASFALVFVVAMTLSLGN